MTSRKLGQFLTPPSPCHSLSQTRLPPVKKTSQIATPPTPRLVNFKVNILYYRKDNNVLTINPTFHYIYANPEIRVFPVLGLGVKGPQTVA